MQPGELIPGELHPIELGGVAGIGVEPGRLGSLSLGICDFCALWGFQRNQEIFKGILGNQVSLYQVYQVFLVS